MWHPETLAIILVTFVLAGTIKGVIGLGLPTVSLALLTATLGLKEAMVLMLVPSFVTNVWQAVAGKSLTEILRRLWAFLAAGSIGTWFFAGILARADSTLFAGLLGLTLLVYSGVGLAAVRMPSPGHWESWISPVIGAVTGTLAGLTGSFVVPAVPYFQALQLPRDELVQAMGIWFTVATVVLAVAFQRQHMLPLEQGALSALAVIPALGGMVLGQKIRQGLSETKFRQVFFASLAVLGIYIAGRAFL